MEKALAFLESNEDARLGGQCLHALCFLKNGREINHPRIQAAIKRCEVDAQPKSNPDIYSLGLAIIFLCEVDPQKHGPLIEYYTSTLISRQKPHGGFGYSTNTTGDTSQSQYAALGLWMAARTGFEVPMPVIEKLCGWLLRTQDPSGAWGYQGVDSGGMQRVKQENIRPSLVAGGLGSVYICSDLLGITNPKKPEVKKETPSALVPVVTAEEREKKRDGVSKNIDAGVVRQSMADGNAWFAKNFTLESGEWTHYYLYGLERYYSYRELAEGQPDPNPDWYNKGFAMLQSTQKPDGSWNGMDTPANAAAFSVLFLCRSSGKTVNKIAPSKLGEGVLLGGMGLPPNTADLQERGGKLVETKFIGSVDEMLSLLEQPGNPELEQLAASGRALPLDGDVTKRSGELAKLRSLVGAGPFESRLVAVRTLGRVRELDNVPVLIYALSDPDVRIVREADKALRFISRKFAGVGLPAEPQAHEIPPAIAAWKEWLKSVRPDADFLD